jgi:membrane fusion protein (multidrug efflux system)
MKRFLPVFLTLLVLIPVIIWLSLWLLERQKYESTDDAYLKANMVLISPKVSGHVTELLIDENQRVKKGDLLVAVDNRDYQAKVQQAEADIEEGLAYKKRLLAMKTSQQAHTVAVQANIAAAQARLTPIAKDVQRFTALTARGSAPMQMLDNVKAQSKQTAAEIKAQQATLTEEQRRLSTFDVEMTEADARIKNSQAALALAKLDLEHTQIRAAIDGIIGKRGVQLGQLVQPGMTLAYLVEDKKIWLEANFKETQLEKMRIGQPAMIKVDAYPDVELQGTVESFSPASGSEFSILPPENATGNFTKIVRRVPVKIVFNKGTDLSLLKAGFSAEVKVKVK